MVSYNVIFQTLGNPYYDMKFDKKRITIDKTLGTGSSSIVYQGRLDNGPHAFLNLQNIVVKRFFDICLN